MLGSLLLLAAAPQDAYRVAVERLPISVPTLDAAACATRELSRIGRATQIQTADGLAIDWAISAPFAGASGSAYVTVQFHDKPDRYIAILYRHPISAKAATSLARSLGDKCFHEDWNAWASANGEKPLR